MALTRIGTETLVNGYMQTGNQFEPKVTALTEGGYVVTWTDKVYGAPKVFGEVYDADGDTVPGGHFEIGSADHTPSVAPLSGGGFIVTWEDSNGDIRGQRFASDGSVDGSNFLVNTVTSGQQTNASVAALADGGFIVVWQDEGPGSDDTDGSAVRGRVYSAEGVGSAPFLVNDETLGNQITPTVTGLSDGGFAVAWTTTYSMPMFDFVNLRTFGADGTPDGARLDVGYTMAESSPSIAGLSDGGYVVTWRSDLGFYPDDTSASAIIGQVLQRDGTASGTLFLVNTTTSGIQSQPQVTALSGGGFLVAWRDDSSPSTVRGQIFTSEAGKSGAEFLINTITSGAQQQPSVAALPNGRFVAAWVDESYDMNIKAQRFDTGAPVLGQLNGDTLSYQLGAAAAVIDQGTAATITDLDAPTSFNGGKLTARLGGTGRSGDVLAIRNQGSGTGQIGIGGTDVTFGGTVIGSFTGGSGGTNLVVTLNGSASVAATEALLRNVTFASSGSVAASRTVSLSLNDGTGGVSSAAVTVTVTAPPSGGGGGGGGGSDSTQTIDGVSVQQSVRNNADGSTTQTLIIPVVTSGRQESDPTTSNADVPLVTAGGQTLLEAHLPVGVGLRVESTTATGGTVQGLIRAIQNGTQDDAASQGVMTGIGQSFLDGLPQGANLTLRTIVPVLADPTTAPSQPLVISGSSAGGDGMQREAVVIDATGLPSGTIIEIANVEFAAVIGAVRLVGGAGSQTVTGDGAAQYMVLGAENDTLHGGGGNDYVGSRTGNDVLFGDTGADTVTGGEDADVVYGNQQDDAVYGNQGDDTLFGGQDQDSLFGGQDGDFAYGNRGNDVVYGNKGNDSLFGGQGADTLFGGQGDDRLFGKLGDDVLTGGLGADLFAFQGGSGNDRITDFSFANGDRLFAEGLNWTVSDGADGAVVTFGSGDTVTLSSIRADQITGAWFTTS